MARTYILLIYLSGPMLVSMGIQGAPVGGVDYPRTYQEFRE
ncbi:IS1595 family transposase, partial [Mycolicibacterium austroafricanum]